jgi:hypothetical protein
VPAVVILTAEHEECIIMYVLLSADECGCAPFILIDLVHTSAGEQSHRCVSERSH